MLQRQNGNNAFQGAGRAQRVGGHGFGRTHRNGIGALAEDFLNRFGFRNIIDRSRCAVGIDIINIFNRKAAVFKRRLHGHGRRRKLFHRAPSCGKNHRSHRSPEFPHKF